LFYHQLEEKMAVYENKGFYRIEANKSKKRLYLNYFGHWESPNQVSEYVEHVRKAVEELKEGGFSTLAQIDDTKPPKLALNNLHKQVQQIQKDAGVQRVAIVIKPGLILQKLTLSVVGRLSGLPQKVFNSVEEGGAWLDAEMGK